MFSFPRQLQHGIPLTRPINVPLAWLLWGILFLVVVGMILAGNRRTVTPAYATGAQMWVEGKSLYNGTGEGFIYFPQSALLFVPFHQLPHATSEICWRMLTAGFFVAGIWRLAQLGRRAHGVRLFPLMTLICIPLCFSSLRNGQATLLMAGLMMLAVVDQCDGRWWRATLWLCFGLVAKPLMAVPILLAVALYPAMRPRLVTGLLVVLGFPFLFQRPVYVLSTYADCWQMLLDARQHGFDVYFAQLFGMLRVFGVEVLPVAQTMTRAVMAAATLALCWWALRKRSPHQAHAQQFALAATYLMLMNPRTENNTYSLVAPAIAFFCAQELFVRRRYVPSGILLASAVMILSSYELGKFFVPPGQAVFLAPLGCLVAAVVLVRDVLRNDDCPTQSEVEQKLDAVADIRRAA